MSALILLLALARADEGPEALVAKALATHPDLASRHAVVAAMDARAGASRAWPDPMLEVAVMDVPVDSWKFSREPMAGVELRLEQPLPDLGSLRRTEEIAQADVAMAQADEAEAGLVLAREVETAFWGLALVRQQVALYERHIAAAEELIETVRLRYEVGAIGQSSLARLELLRGRLEQDRAELLRTGAEVQADLARATGDPAPVETPLDTAPLPPTGDVAAWTTDAKGARPMLGAIASEAHRARAQADLARATAAPDVTLFASYRFRFEQEMTDMGGGSDLFSAGLMLPIPLSARVSSAERAASLEEASAATSRLEAATLQVEADLAKIHAAWTRASEKAAAFESEILPAARRVRDVTLADYRVGKAEFEALYMAEVDLLELEREARAAAIETRILAAEARAAIGSPP